MHSVTRRMFLEQSAAAVSIGAAVLFKPAKNSDANQKNKIERFVEERCPYFDQPMLCRIRGYKGNKPPCAE